MKPRYLFPMLLSAALILLFSGLSCSMAKALILAPSGEVLPIPAERWWQTQASLSLTLVPGQTRHTTTNSGGEYQMFGLPSGKYKVTHRGCGYEY